MNIPLTVTFERWIIDLVVQSEENPDTEQRGMTINSIWQNTNYMYKRSIDFAILRSDNAHIPEHLWSYSVSSFMETVKKERRLRLFTTAEFQRIMRREGQVIEGYPAMTRPKLTGHFGDISFKTFYSSEIQLNKFLDNAKSLNGDQKPKPMGRPPKVPIKTTKSKSTTKSTQVVEDEESDDEEEGGKKGKKGFKYSDTVQVRGRPRKYVHVVEEDGSVNRRIIGTVYSRDDLPQVLVYLKERNILVTPPLGYTGLGPPPPATEEAIRNGHPPEYYYQFPARDSAAYSGLPGRKSKARAKKEAEAAAAAAAGETDSPTTTVQLAETNVPSNNKDKGKKGKKRAKGAGGSGSEAGAGTPSTARKSKRQKKEVNYADKADLDVDQDAHAVNVVPGPISDGIGHEQPSEKAGPIVEPTASHPDSANDEHLVDPALTEPSSRVLTPAESVDPVGQVIEAQTADITISSPAPPAATKDKQSGKKRGKSGKKQVAEPKQEIVDDFKRSGNNGQNVKAVVPPQPVSGTEDKRNHALDTLDTRSTAGSRFFPIDIPDDSLFDQSMEDSIGNVLAELSHSGVRPRSQPPTAEPSAPSVATTGSSSTMTGRKRKSDIPTHAEPPPKTTKTTQGKAASEAFDDRRTSLFVLPEEPMEELPFELPEDIFTTGKSSAKDGEEANISDTAASTNDPPLRQPAVPIEVDVTPDVQILGTTVAVDPPRADEPSPSPSQADNVMPAPSCASTPFRSTPQPTTLRDISRAQSATPLREVSAAPSDTLATPSTPQRGVAQPIRNKKLLHALNDCKWSLSLMKHCADNLGLAAKPARVDLGTIRKANELVQVLHDNGGVMMDSKLIHEHRNWTFKYAGTDHPNAPPVAYGMDRLVVKKTVNILLSDGRIKETIVSVPTPTGRWVKSNVLYLTDLPHEQLQAYIRQMSTSVSQSMTPNARRGKPDTPSLPATPYTELKRSAPRNGGKLAFDATPTRNSTSGAPRPFSERRTALLKELKVVGQLLGWKASRVVRVQILHRAIIRALSREGCGSVVSTSPRIFAFPLLCEDITAEEWFSCCLLLQYNEEIEHWLRDPVNRATKVKDVPRQYRPLGGFGGSSTKAKMNTLLQIMVTLKIISPVIPAAKEESDFFGDHSESNGFKVESGSINSTFYLLHDMVPVYHIASLPPPLLGLLPARNEEEINTLWSTIKKASLEMQVDALGRIGERTKPTLPHAAKFEDTLDLSIDYTKLLQRPKRWKSDLTLLPIQKAALDEVFDRTTGQNSINTQQELEDFAYENALPLPFLETEIKRRAELAKDNAAKIAERLREHALKAQQRQQDIQEKIRQKLIERQEAARVAWEEKVSSSAQRKSVEYTPELLGFVSHQTIQSGSMKMSDATESIIDYWVMMWEHIKNLSPQERETALEERRRYQAERVRLTAPKFKYSATSKRRSAKKPKEPKSRSEVLAHDGFADPFRIAGPQKRTRSKRKWTHEDDDLLLDAEAIIRARSRASGYKGRQAISQLFPQAVASTIRSRLTKIVSQPGKKAYYERLEQAWYELWMKIRGTAELVDEHLESPFEFDLKDHIRVLREKIDKRPLRLLAAATPEEEKEPVPDLLSDSYQITEEFTWKYVETEQHSFDQAADALSAEEIKINATGSISILDEPRIKEEVAADNKQMGLLQASMKMIVGTPDAYYDVTHGKRLLDTWSNETCQVAIQSMMDNNVLKRVPNPSRDNERQYGFSQGWQQLEEGFLPPNLFQAAQGLKSKLEPEEGVEWPLIGESGELAALMDMVSYHEVDFEYDVHEFPTVKYEKGHFNTRKLDDDAYEFALQVKRTTRTNSSPKVPFPDTKIYKSLRPWNYEVDDNPGTQHTVQKVIEAVKQTAEDGITKPELLDVIRCSPVQLDRSLAVLSSQDDHTLFWTGYDTARLVLREHWESWCVKVTLQGSKLTDGNAVLLGPRRWYDVYGVFKEDDFVKVVESVKSLVISRPGITLKTIRTKLATILDRLELIDILQYLVDQDKIEAKWSEVVEEDDTMAPPLESVDVDQEDDLGLFPVVNGVWD
ncbi:hypothetical protein L486_05463 [Kwoniella mangroviensis CBS 10435]|uniref:Transcription factor tau subunit sfc3/Tfc3 C-terminal domain-containing protein n=1 Tax=Kwoniella mangroviensis CBS 10435 TaxID=1331196 RepID=A0A1B9IMF6_9TREE|nr:hypothetical protein L486_05463 [Kwoniella mangroviensis CBS 10435]